MATTWVQKVPPVQSAPPGWFSPAEAIQTVRWSADDRIVATAGFDGLLNGFDARTGKRDFSIDCNAVRTGGNPGSPTTDRRRLDAIPITSIRWRPGQRHVVFVARSNGSVLQWDIREDRCLSAWSEEPNEIYSMDLKRDGTKVATAGQDATLRIWDTKAGEVERELKVAGDFEATVHALRIYAVKWKRDDDNVIVTAGWENTVRIWDLRTAKGTVMDIFGPHVSGEGIDLHEGQLITASHRVDNQLELWDAGSGKRISVLGDKEGNMGSMLTCCQFSRQGVWVAAGGGGGQGLHNVATTFERSSGEPGGGVPETDLQKPVMCCDFNHQDNGLAFGDGKGQLHLLELKRR
eukprot:TRINITY_DN46756_c0_g1_i1.p1 TRINITY_DN46756_c0_g1~~TRINITY_DN46756_c0_g1_i1.p1  ORF type:complete len:363 (+),score=103.76 TRINITY_DN46756_c0_g1_i1:44-1090(+)